jgi:NADH-quinone oxidoreductase subunit A
MYSRASGNRPLGCLLRMLGDKMHLLPSTPWYSPWEVGPFSLGLFAVLCLAFVLAMLMVSSRIGERRYSREKMRPYECGVIPTGTARLRYPVPFYLVAIFFLLFDVEGAFIFSWAVSFRELGWQGWLEILFFIAMQMLGLVYVWKKGGLEWGPMRKKA